MEKGYLVQEKNDLQIITEAVKLRKIIKDLSYDLNVVHHFIDFPHLECKFLANISINLVNDNEIDPCIEAVSYPDKEHINLRNSYYEHLVNYIDNKTRTGIALRAKFTLVHELYHVLAHKNVGMQRATFETPISKCSESQANKFAGAFLIPPFHYPELKQLTEHQISHKCGVSKGCAFYQMKLYRQLENQLGSADAVRKIGV